MKGVVALSQEVGNRGTAQSRYSRSRSSSSSSSSSGDGAE